MGFPFLSLEMYPSIPVCIWLNLNSILPSTLNFRSRILSSECNMTCNSKTVPAFWDDKETNQVTKGKYDQEKKHCPLVGYIFPETASRHFPPHMLLQCKLQNPLIGEWNYMFSLHKCGWLVTLNKVKVCNFDHTEVCNFHCYFIDDDIAFDWFIL